MSTNNNNNSGGKDDTPTSPPLLSPSANTNRRNTFCKAKSFKKSGFSLDTSASSSNNNTYKLLNGDEYDGPDLQQIQRDKQSALQSPPTTPRVERSASIASNSSTGSGYDEEDAKIPVYLGADGTMYNKYYIMIKILGIDEPTPIKNVSFQPPKVSSLNPNDPVYSTGFPESSGYDNYFDYEQAVMDWGDQVKTSLGVVQLPRAMGRAYSRPRNIAADRMLRKNSEASNDDSFSLNDGNDPNGDNNSTGGNSGTNQDDDKNSNASNPTIVEGSSSNNNNNSTNPAIRSRSGSDTSTGSFEGSTQMDGNSPLDGSPLGSSIMNPNGTRSRSNSSTYFDPRTMRSNSLSPKQLQSRLGESGDLIKLGRGASLLGMDEDRWNLSKDPWDSMLVLQEPIPELYNTFEDYEFAMRNWAIEVILKTPILPPHASQLSQLPQKDKVGGNASAAADVETITKQTSRMTLGEHHSHHGHHHHHDVGSHWRVRSGIVDVKSDEELLDEEYIDVNQRLFDAAYGNGSRFFEHVQLRADKQWKKMENGEGKINLVDSFDKWYRKKLTIHRQSLTLYKGGTWSNHLLMPTIPNGWKDALIRKQAILPPLPIRALRRLDINSEADGKRVEYLLLSPAMPLDLHKILRPNMNIQYILSMFDSLSQTNPLMLTQALATQEESKQYIKNCRVYDRRLVHSFRFDSMYSWEKHPAQQQSSDVQAQLQSSKQDIEAILLKQPFDLASVIAMVNTPQVYLDKFQEVFDFDVSTTTATMYAPVLPPLNLPTSASVNASGATSPGSSPTTHPANNTLSASSSSVMMSNPNLQSSIAQSTSPSTPTKSSFSFTGNSGTPASPVPHHLMSPQSRSGSHSNFNLGSPATNKILLSPSSHVSSSVLSSSSGIESPRSFGQSGSLLQTQLLQQQQQQQQSSSTHGGSPRSNTGTSPSQGPSHLTGTTSNANNSYTSHFFNYVTTSSFPELLSLFEKVNSPLAHAKLSCLILACIASEKGRLLIDHIIDSKDIHSLYRMAQGVTYFDAVPLDLYPYPIHLNQVMTPHIAKGSTPEVVRLVFMYYYLNLIHERVLFYSSNQSVLSCIKTTLKDIADKIGVQTQNDKELLSKIFRALGRKSATVSHCFLFILIQLMKMTEYPTIISWLKLKDSLLLQLRDLCESKFLHSQFAAKRIFNILQEDQWKEFLYSEYSEKDALINDLQSTKGSDNDNSPPTTRKIATSSKGTPPKPTAPPSENNSSLLAELVLNMCITTLESFSSSTLSSIRFLVNDQVFMQIYNAVVKSKKYDKTNENLAKLFALLCKTAVRFSLVKKSDTIKINKKSTTEQEILVSPPFMLELSYYVFTPIAPNDKTLIKNYMLESFRHLLKPTDLFEIIKKEANLYNKLIVTCREGKNPELNRNAWRLFFQIIRLHPGHIEFLDKNKYLTQFIDLINTNAGPVVLSNSLHYLTKLFALVPYETRRANLWKRSSSDAKNTEKDVKTLRDFFTERHMFIKIHMVYRRYMESYPGRPFIILCNLYQALATLPICQRLIKDTQKNADYKEGFTKIQKWFKDDSHLGPMK